MLADREGARRFRDYRKADEIRDALRAELGIQVDDDARTVSLSPSLSLSLSIHIYISFYLSIYLSIYFYIYLSIYVYLYLYLYLTIYPSMCRNLKGWTWNPTISEPLGRSMCVSAPWVRFKS